MRSDVLQVRGGKLAALLMTYPQLIGVDVGAGTGQSSGARSFTTRSLAPILSARRSSAIWLSGRPPVHHVDHGGVDHHVVGQFELTKSSIDGFSHRLYVSQLLRPVVSVALIRRAISKGVRHHVAFAPAFAACRRRSPMRSAAASMSPGSRDRGDVCACDLSFIGPFDESIGRPFG
jgi:hypothetical protein